MRRFCDHHPSVQFLYFAGVLLCTMFAYNPLISVISLLGAVGLWLLTGGGSWRTVGGLLLFFIILTAVNPLFSHNGSTVLFFINENPVTLESLLYGANGALSLLSVLLWCISLSRLFTSERIYAVLGTVSPKLALIFSMALRFFPHYRKTAMHIRMAQQGLQRIPQLSLLQRMRFEGRVFSALTSYALENGITTADSMEARGYGCRRRTLFTQFRFRPCDAVLCGLTLFCGGGSAVCLITGVFQTAFFPIFQKMPTGPFALIGYALFAVLCLFPMFLEIGAYVQWNLSKSNISPFLMPEKKRPR